MTDARLVPRSIAAANQTRRRTITLANHTKALTFDDAWERLSNEQRSAIETLCLPESDGLSAAYPNVQPAFPNKPPQDMESFIDEDAITAALASISGLRRKYYALVPLRVTERTFWRNFFSHVTAIRDGREPILAIAEEPVVQEEPMDEERFASDSKYQPSSMTEIKPEWLTDTWTAYVQKLMVMMMPIAGGAGMAHTAASAYEQAAHAASLVEELKRTLSNCSIGRTFSESSIAKSLSHIHLPSLGQEELKRNLSESSMARTFSESSIAKSLSQIHLPSLGQGELKRNLSEASIASYLFL